MLDFFGLVTDTIYDTIDFLIHYDYSGVIYRFETLAVALSFLFICGIIYAVAKANQIFKLMHAYDEPENVPSGNDKNQEDWNKILEKGKSDNENNRKLALISADSLIEKILALAGYSGENLGEKLKNIEPADLDSLDALWEAHKIRNRIAHEISYRLSKEDAERGLSLFEKALRELEYI